MASGRNPSNTYSGRDIARLIIGYVGYLALFMAVIGLIAYCFGLYRILQRIGDDEGFLGATVTSDEDRIRWDIYAEFNSLTEERHVALMRKHFRRYKPQFDALKARLLASAKASQWEPIKRSSEEVPVFRKIQIEEAWAGTHSGDRNGVMQKVEFLVKLKNPIDSQVTDKREYFEESYIYSDGDLGTLNKAEDTKLIRLEGTWYYCVKPLRH